MTPETAAKSALTEALAAVQAKLPEVRKGETATVPTKTGGSYKYSYADLAEVSKAVLPILGEHGLTWITKPTLNAAGKFVLAYKLKHVSGEEETGEYPLSGGTAQEMGSAITYARRYCLCAVTGVAPESDDDDGAAASQRRDSWEQAKPLQQQKPDRREIVPKAANAIAMATTQDELDTYRERVGELEQAGDITAEDAVVLRRQIVARLDALFPEATPQPEGAEAWPEPAEVPA